MALADWWDIYSQRWFLCDEHRGTRGQLWRMWVSSRPVEGKWWVEFSESGHLIPLLRFDANLPVFTKACSVEAKGHLIFSKKAQRHDHSSPSINRLDVAAIVASHTCKLRLVEWMLAQRLRFKHICLLHYHSSLHRFRELWRLSSRQLLP